MQDTKGSLNWDALTLTNSQNLPLLRQIVKNYRQTYLSLIRLDWLERMFMRVMKNEFRMLLATEELPMALF